MWTFTVHAMSNGMAGRFWGTSEFDEQANFLQVTNSIFMTFFYRRAVRSVELR